MWYNESNQCYIEKIKNAYLGKKKKEVKKYMEQKIILPKIATALYQGKDAPEVLSILDMEIQKLPGEFLYADQISLKLREALLLLKDTDNENIFLKKIRDKWSKDLRQDFIKSNILYDSTLRRKSVFSIFLKMNRIMTDGKSIDSLHDLMGMEFEIFTPHEYDTQESIDEAYTAANILLNYFSNSKRSGEKFMLCNASELKNVYPLEKMLNKAERPQILKHFRAINPNCFIPEKTGLLQKYIGFVKDYYRQPKINSAYQGLQFVIKTQSGIYLEIQIKTQPVCEFRNDPKSPAYHDNFRAMQNLQNQQKVCTTTGSIPQFDMNFDPKKVTHIYGFRTNPELDKSGIMAPVCWALRKNTHH